MQFLVLLCAVALLAAYQLQLGASTRSQPPTPMQQVLAAPTPSTASTVAVATTTTKPGTSTLTPATAQPNAGQQSTTAHQAAIGQAGDVPVQSTPRQRSPRSATASATIALPADQSPTVTPTPLPPTTEPLPTSTLPPDVCPIAQSNFRPLAHRTPVRASPPADQPTPPISPAPMVAQTDTPLADFDAAVRALVAAYTEQGVRVGVVIANVDQGESIQIAADDEFATASLYKLFVLWQVQVEIARGRLHDDQVLTYCPDDDDSEDDGWQIGDYGDQFTVAELRQMMITRSNNTATWMLANRIGRAAIDQAISANGFPHSSVIAGVSTPNEITRFFRRLLAGTLDPLLTEADYTLMLDLLKAQEINHLLPIGLPPDAVFAHKTGTLAGVVNDAGIIFLPDGGTIVITIMAEGDEGTVQELMGALAALTWQFATNP